MINNLIKKIIYVVALYAQSLCLYFMLYSKHDYCLNALIVFYNVVFLRTPEVLSKLNRY